MRGGADTALHTCSQQIKLMVVGKITKEAEKDTAKVSIDTMQLLLSLISLESMTLHM